MSFLDSLLASVSPKPATPPAASPGTEKNGTPHAPTQEEVIQANAAVGGGDAMKTEKEKAVDIWGAKPAESAIKSSVFGPTDTAKFDTAVTQMDFLKGLDPAIVQKAQSGDAAALSQLVNHVGQNSYKSAALSSKELIEQGVASKVGEIREEMKAEFRAMSGMQAIDKANPAFTDPEVSPMLTQFKSQLRAAYPTATPEELAKHAQDRLVTIARKIIDGSPEGMAAAEKKKTSDTPPALTAASWLT